MSHLPHHTDSLPGTAPDHACDGCALVTRRDLLLGVAAAAAAALVGLGASPARAMAAPIRFVSALGGGREDKAYPIPAADGTQIDRDNDTILTRWQGKVYVYDLGCPHQNTVLRWSDKKAQFECPKHHSRFTPDGIYVEDSGRATRGLDRFAVRREGDTIVANLDALYRQDENETKWTAAFIAV